MNEPTKSEIANEMCRYDEQAEQWSEHDDEEERKPRKQRKPKLDFDFFASTRRLMRERRQIQQRQRYNPF